MQVHNGFGSGTLVFKGIVRGGVTSTTFATQLMFNLKKI